MFKITMYKADNGDCISIQTENTFVLIDGGTAQSFDTWKESIVGQFEKIDLLIITHIDNDHTNGIIKLLEAEGCPEIEQVYFNGVEQLFSALDDTDKPDRRVDIKLNALANECMPSSDKENIGYSEGTSLSYILNKQSLKCNELISGQAIFIENTKKFDIGALKFEVIGPDSATLSELKNNWQYKLDERGIRPKIINKSFANSFEAYIQSFENSTADTTLISSVKVNSIASLANEPFVPDNSLTNKSSFSFLIEHNHKRILYLGDCHAETVISWLDNNQIDKIKVDAVKISHHGSRNNTSLALLERIDCQEYLISTNGKSHGHPHLETLARIAVINQHTKTNIYFNYDLKNIPTWFTHELYGSYENINLCMDTGEVEL
ncbi:ComEC/Rec2 family competence protein [Psychrobacter sp. AOP7-C1-14]|uniref:ComEC/Rec2 family competence protein n=1 Tax=Psychrobacter sp. AOP7-C1-14 TaxID=3457640 RepID=UPI00402B41C4